MQVVTLIIALYGAALATWLATRQWRARIKVEAQVGCLIAPGEPDNPRLLLYAVNHGHVAVEIRAVWINDGGKNGIMVHSNLPKRLTHGDQVHVWTAPHEPLPSDLRSITFLDSLSREWDAKPDVLAKVRKQIAESLAEADAR